MRAQETESLLEEATQLQRDTVDYLRENEEELDKKVQENEGKLLTADDRVQELTMTTITDVNKQVTSLIGPRGSRLLGYN